MAVIPLLSGICRTDISAGRTARNMFSGVASLQVLILLNFLDTDFDLISSMDKLEDSCPSNIILPSAVKRLSPDLKTL